MSDYQKIQIEREEALSVGSEPFLPTTPTSLQLEEVQDSPRSLELLPLPYPPQYQNQNQGQNRAEELDGPVVYQEVVARSILNRVQAMMPLAWTINPYRGCRHACVYCFARPTHTYYGLNAGVDFHSRIFVKVNAAKLLRKELSRSGWQGETICLGSATDPYQGAERRYRLSRQLLEVLCEFSNPLDIITKSHLILDDLELLVELNRRTGGKVAVNMSLTTLDEAKARLIDPGAPSPAKRLAAMQELSAAGIKTRLFIMPVLPGITDDPTELEALVKAGQECGVEYVAADALRIARGLEDYFYTFLDRHYPRLKPRYERLYHAGRSTLADTRYREALKAKMAELRTRYGLGERALPAKEGLDISSESGNQATSAVYEEPLTLQTALEAAEQQTGISSNSHGISATTAQTSTSATNSDQATLTSSPEPEQGRVILGAGLGRSKRSRPVIPPQLEKQASFEL